MSLEGLEVSGLNGKQFYGLPEVYTWKRTPVTHTDNIITENELAKWPYLDGVHIPHIQAEVELLIGTNDSKMLEPWEVINTQGNGPYSIRTLLGWVLNGPLPGCNVEWCESGSPAATVNKISIANPEELLNNQYNHDFKGITSEDKDEMSRDDVMFMEIMKDSVELQNGHYSLKLPFEKEEVSHCQTTHSWIKEV